MKKKFGLRTGSMFLLSMGILLGSAGTLDAQELLNINFSAAQGYMNGPVVGQPAGAANQWLNLVDTGIAGLAPADPYFIDSEKLVVAQDGSGASWVYIEFPPQTKGDLILTWDWQYVGPEDENIDVGINLSDSANYSLDITEGSLSGWGRQTTTARMREGGGVIDLYNGDSYDVLTDFSYTDGVVISMRYIIHLDEKTFDVFAQKEGEAEVALGIGYGYRRDVSAETGGLDHLSIWESGSAITECHIDNIVLVASGGVSAVWNWSLYR